MRSKDALTNFRSLLESGNVSEAVKSIPRIQEQFATRRQREVALTTTANEILNESSLDEQEDEPINRLLQLTSVIEEERIEFDFILLGLVKGDATAEDVLTRVNSILETREEITQRSTELFELAAGLSVSPVFVLLGDNSVNVPKGSQFTQQVSIENLSNSPVANVEITLESDIASTVSPATLSEIPPNSTESIEIRGDASETGEFSARIRADSEQRTDSLSINVTVASKSDYLQRAEQLLDQLRLEVIKILNSMDDSRSKGKKKGSGVKGIQNKLRTAAKRLDSVQDEVAGDRGGQSVDNKIGAIVDLLETVETQALVLEDTQLDATTAGELSQEARGIIEALEKAIKAAPEG